MVTLQNNFFKNRKQLGNIHHGIGQKNRKHFIMDFEENVSYKQCTIYNMTPKLSFLDGIVQTI